MFDKLWRHAMLLYMPDRSLYWYERSPMGIIYRCRGAQHVFIVLEAEEATILV